MIQNIVASAGLHKRIDVEIVADILDDVMYEPEQFPGFIYRMRDPKTVLLLFNSSKLVCTSAKIEEMVHEFVNRIYDVLESYELFHE